MALHFATSGEVLSNIEKENCVLWKIDINELNNLLPNSYFCKLWEKRNQAYLMTTDMLDDLLEKSDAITQYDVDMAGKAFVL